MTTDGKRKPPARKPPLDEAALAGLGNEFTREAREEAARVIARALAASAIDAELITPQPAGRKPAPRKRMLSEAEQAGLRARQPQDVLWRGKRGMLHVELLARLRDMIVEGELAPGTKLSEPMLCARFDVSRTPLREAFKALAADGLVTLRPRRGAVVAQLDPKEVEEMFAVMGALEALSGELAARRVTDFEIKTIAELHALMLRFYAEGDRHAYFALNQEIHERILAAARNPTLSTIYGGLAGRVRRARYLANMSRQRWSEAIEEHEAILAALAARDGTALGALLRKHLANKGKAVADVLRKEQLTTLPGGIVVVKEEAGGVRKEATRRP